MVTPLLLKHLVGKCRFNSWVPGQPAHTSFLPGLLYGITGQTPLTPNLPNRTHTHNVPSPPPAYYLALVLPLQQRLPRWAPVSRTTHTTEQTATATPCLGRERERKHTGRGGYSCFACDGYFRPLSTQVFLQRTEYCLVLWSVVCDGWWPIAPSYVAKCGSNMFHLPYHLPHPWPVQTNFISHRTAMAFFSWCIKERGEGVTMTSGTSWSNDTGDGNSHKGLSPFHSHAHRRFNV